MNEHESQLRAVRRIARRLLKIDARQHRFAAQIRQRMRSADVVPLDQHRLAAEMESGLGAFELLELEAAATRQLAGVRRG